MEKKILLLIPIVFLFSANLLSQWTVYQTNTTMQLNKIQFINENTGFAAGGGPFYDSAVFVKTTNAGVNWIKYRIYDSTAIPLQEVYGLYFINENTGFVCGRYLNIYRTTNGGINWKAIEPPYYNLIQIYNSIFFIDENTGYIAGRYGYFCKTTNSGLNWALKADLDGNLYGVHFINQNTGFIAAQTSGVYKTTNSGQNFSFYYLGDYGFESVKFISETKGFIVGRDAYFHSGVYKTTNSGLAWESSLLCDCTLYDVFFVNQNTGYLSGENVIFKTTNSGINWNLLNVPDNNGFLSIHFITIDYGFISGGYGKIYKTISGGVGINQTALILPNNIGISKCYPNPFNSDLKVQIALNQKIINNSDIVLEVYNSLGNKVMVEKLNINNPGDYETLLRFNNFASGIYFIRIKCCSFATKPQKVILLK